MQARHADVVQPIDLVAHDLGRDGGLLGDRQVGGAGGGDDDDAPARRRVAPPLDDPRLLVKDGVGDPGPDRRKGGRVRAGHQQAVPAGDDGGGDAGDLVGGLPGAEHHLGKTLADGPVMIDPGKPEVLDRRQLGERPRLQFCVRRVETTLPHGLEQRAQRQERLGGDFRFCHGFDV